VLSLESVTSTTHRRLKVCDQLHQNIIVGLGVPIGSIRQAKRGRPAAGRGLYTTIGGHTLPPLYFPSDDKLMMMIFISDFGVMQNSDVSSPWRGRWMHVVAMFTSKTRTRTRSFTQKPILLLVLLVVLATWQSAFLVTRTAPPDDVEVNAAPPPPKLGAREKKHDEVAGERNVTVQHRPKLPITKLIHVAKFGAGHRLCRTSTAWHLAKRFNLTHIKFQWKTCDAKTSVGPPIFPYLFGNDTWEIESNAGKPVYYGKEVLVRNDVYGYVSGQALKNHFIPLSSRYRQSDGPFLEKLASDKELYQLLESRYMFRSAVLEFMQQHDFDNHFVIGLHLRAGNGEQAHFVESGRGIANETEFVTNLADSIGHFIQSIRKTHPERLESKPPLIFLATDTAYLVNSFTNRMTKEFGVNTILFPQLRLKKNQGVTFSALQGSGETCLQGWQAMFNDMFLLSHANVLIAAQKSTFTQSLPMSLVFDRFRKEAGPHFCEVSMNATHMTCYQDLATWLFRDYEVRMFSYSTDGHIETVLHKLVVLLPDVKFPKDLADLEHFLHKDDPSNAVLTHTYGGKIYYPKYRNTSNTELAPLFNIVS
jgi:hypothetical protein